MLQDNVSLFQHIPSHKCPFLPLFFFYMCDYFLPSLQGLMGVSKAIDNVKKKALKCFNSVILKTYLKYCTWLVTPQAPRIDNTHTRHTLTHIHHLLFAQHWTIFPAVLYSLV